MNSNDTLETLLKENLTLENKIKQQNTKLIELEAHKKTIILSLGSKNYSTHYPIHYDNKIKELIEVEDKYKFYILNIGSVENINKSNQIIIPNNYIILKKFIKSKLIKSKSNFVFYTSTLFYKNNEYHYEIKDEENNVWKGSNVFELFKNSFNQAIPFCSIQDWFGLHNPKVQIIIKSLKQ